ncbi:hypothetical protein FRB90_002317 [Tulasnella sp. 427]|nr:hypothetical protein FRB90_002317 [Tulasnella sp. 427]
MPVTAPGKTSTHTDARYYDTRDNHNQQKTTTSYARADSYAPRQPHRSRSGDSMPSLNRRPSTTRFAPGGMPSRSASTDSYPVPPPPKPHHSHNQHNQHHNHHYHNYNHIYNNDNAAGAEPDFSSLPPNAFNIMHAWELDSLEKWQARLEQVRKDQKVLKARIDALRQDEERLWAENARGATSRKPPTTQPQRKRSTSSFSSSAESDAEYESALPRRTSNGSLRAQFHPNGPTYYQQRPSARSDDHATRMQALYVELAALQDQLSVCAETEDKATRALNEIMRMEDARARMMRS